MNRPLLFMLLLVAATVGRGAGFDQGNDLYAAGKFAEAAKAYETQVSHGDYSANLFYNLANADFRLGQRGKAILNYRRALLLEPAHTEAGANLAFIRGGGENPVAASSAPWAWGASIAGWIAVGSLLVGAISRPRRGGAWSLAAVSVLAAAGCVAAIHYWTNDEPNATAAIVVDDKTRAFYAPAESSSVVTTLPAGEEIHVVADRGAWLYLQLPNGTRGWMQSAKVERLIPRPG